MGSVGRPCRWGPEGAEGGPPGEGPGEPACRGGLHGDLGKSSGRNDETAWDLVTVTRSVQETALYFMLLTKLPSTVL